MSHEKSVRREDSTDDVAEQGRQIVTELLSRDLVPEDTREEVQQSLRENNPMEALRIALRSQRDET